MITIEATGPLAVIEDLGRPGHAGYGVSGSGAADRAALTAANRLLGNDHHDAGIEVLLGGLVITTDRPTWCVVTGPATTVLVNSRPEPSHTPIHCAAGDRLEVQPAPYGLRNYLALRGGIEVPTVLGSRSTDLLSGLGPAPLQPGDRLPIGRPTAPFPGADVTPQPRPMVGTAWIDLEPGPRSDWFTTDAVTALFTRPWTVTPDSDRTAVRLDGPPLQRSSDPALPTELPSEGLLRGAVQVPPSGLPLIFGSDHPVTGGYPVVAVAGPRGCDLAAQLRPGDTLRFRRSSSGTPLHSRGIAREPGRRRN